jgi:hypothetical protein
LDRIWESGLWSYCPTWSTDLPSTIVLVKVEEVLQYFDNNPQSDYLPALLAGQVHPGTETVLVRMSTFVPHFLAPLLLAEHQSLKAMLQLAVLVLVYQDLLLKCKPLVDWLKAAVVNDGTSYVLSVIWTQHF